MTEIKINPEELNYCLHDMLKVVAELATIEKQITLIRHDILKAIDHAEPCKPKQQGVPGGY